MFGGLLLQNSLYSNSQQNTVLLAFSNRFYIFEKQSGILLNNVQFHQSPILHFYYDTDKQVIYSIDKSRTICISRQQNHKVTLQKKIHLKGDNSLIKDAQFYKQNLYYIDSNNKCHWVNLHTNQKKQIGIYSKIVGIWEQFIVLFTKQNQRQIALISTINYSIVLKYDSKDYIKSAIVHNKSLIIGDSSGKIHVLEEAVTGIIGQKIKLQWHLHSVLGLASSVNYLYSGGQQGTLVLWHLKEHTKDFLPRIGAQIVSIQVHNSQIYCFLSDNSLKVIDLSKDRQTVQYKLILNSQGLTTQFNKYTTKIPVFGQIHYNNMQQIICLRSLPGKLQFIQLRTGQNEQVQIVHRNYISRIDEGYPEPHQINSIVFNKNWSLFLASVEGKHCSYLKFYEKISNNNIQNEWILSGKIQNPHTSIVHQCISLDIDIKLQMAQRFLTYSLNDPNIKIWKRFKQKKKSILEKQQQFWNCQFEINYRNRLPKFVFIAKQKLIVTYENQVVIFNFEQRIIQKTLLVSNVQKAYLKNINHQNIFIFVKPNKIVLGSYSNEKKKISLAFNNKPNILFSNKSTFSILVQNSQSTQIFIYNLQANKFQYNCQISDPISGLFWCNNNLILIDSSIIFHNLTSKQELFKFVDHEAMEKIEVQSNETKDIDISVLEHRWINIADKGQQRQYQEIMKNMNVMPSFETGFKLITDHLLL